MNISLFNEGMGARTPANSSQPELSVVVPIYNEVESIPSLIEAIASSLKATNLAYELICVDDGSKDGSSELLKQQAQARPDLRVVLLRRNYGQTAAMAAGFDSARGQVIVTLDGDLQNDPADIPLLLAKLQEGYDMVSGWRQNRQCPCVTTRVVTVAASTVWGELFGC